MIFIDGDINFKIVSGYANALQLNGYEGIQIRY